MNNLAVRLVEIIKRKVNAPKNEKLFLQTKERLCLSSFLPDYSYDENSVVLNEKKEKKEHDKLKICLIHQEPYMYNMIHSLYKVFSEDDNYDIDIVVSAEKNTEHHYSECTKYLQKRGLPFKYDYNCTEDFYDAVFVICVHVPPTREQMLIRDKARFCFAVPSNEYAPHFLLKHKETMLLWKPNAIFCEKRHEECSRGCFEIPIYPTGNPKYDLIYEDCNSKDKELPEQFQKFEKGDFKKTFLYITDHIGSGMKVGPAVSFDLYAKSIFSFFKENQDCCLIFRPYLAYIAENINYGVWTWDDVYRLKSYCNDQSNIIWDEEDSDSLSLSLADAILSDVGCGITTHALPVMKPIGIPLRWDMDCSKLLGDRKEKEECYYLIESEADLMAFFKTVLSNENSKYDGMLKKNKAVVSYYDGKIAQRIKEIISEYLV